MSKRARSSDKTADATPTPAALPTMTTNVATLPLPLSLPPLPPTKTFKFRAECLADVKAVFYEDNFDFEEFQAKRTKMPGANGELVGGSDVEVTMITWLSLKALKYQMALQDDCHVMFKTIRLASDYTGNRNYECIGFEDCDCNECK